MKYASKSIVGLREENEDNLYAPSSESGMQFVAVSDGMGGHAAGDVASNLVITGVVDELSGIYRTDTIARLTRAVQNVNLDVYRTAASSVSMRGMGATLVCALLESDSYIAANVGDSRLYQLDPSGLSRITTDHSYVQMLVDAGSITPEEAYYHPQRNLITRAIGIGIAVDIDIFECEWREGDLLLLCSDGLCGVLKDDDIKEILLSAGTLEEKCESLVSAALACGSSDNITVVLAQNAGGEAV